MVDTRPFTEARGAVLHLIGSQEGSRAMAESQRLLQTLREAFGGSVQDREGGAGHSLLEAAGLGHRRGTGLLAEAERLGFIERQIHGTRTLLVREPTRGWDRLEPRDLIPPSPADIGNYHLERAWGCVQLQNDRLLSERADETITQDFAFYVVAVRWLLRAVQLIRDTVEGAPQALEATEAMRRHIYRMDVRNVFEHFDEREQGNGPRHARQRFPYIAESYDSGGGFATMNINDETIDVPEATEVAKSIYLLARIFLDKVLEEERLVRATD